MTTLSSTKPYGTYQQFKYQTVDLEPMKKLGIGLLKLVAVLFIVLALVVVALTAFQMIFIAATWFVAHVGQMVVVAGVFGGMWMAQPKVVKK